MHGQAVLNGGMFVLAELNIFLFVIKLCGAAKCLFRCIEKNDFWDWVLQHLLNQILFIKVFNLADCRLMSSHNDTMNF